MKLLIHGRNLEVTPAIRDYTENKLARAIHHFDDMVKEADVHLSVARNPRVPQQTAEVTVYANGLVIRAQERSENLYASIDLVASKLSRQLRRFKDRQHDHHHSHGHNATPTPTTEAVLEPMLVEGSLVEGRPAAIQRSSRASMSGTSARSRSRPLRSRAACLCSISAARWERSSITCRRPQERACEATSRAPSSSLTRASSAASVSVRPAHAVGTE